MRSAGAGGAGSRAARQETSLPADDPGRAQRIGEVLAAALVLLWLALSLLCAGP